MRIRSLTAFEVPIRLKSPVRHASFTRHQNDTLIVRCELADGTFGWGEGLPRTYVTGESIESVWRHLESTDFAQLGDREFTNGFETIAILDELQLAEVAPDCGVVPRECFGNSVRCAIELAVLDAICRSQDVPVSSLFAFVSEAADLLKPITEVRYSGVVTSSQGVRQWRSGLKMKLFGFAAVKAKVGMVGVDDSQFLRRIRRMVGRKVDLRLDANEAWRCDEVVKKLNQLAEFSPSAVEQPVPHSEVAGLADVRRDVSVPFILDESLCSISDAEEAIRLGTCDLFNLRISKCGGLINCLRLACLAKQHELGYQLGCQVGETGILSAAGRQFACNIAGIRYLEGSYDRFLVKDRLTTQSLTFHYGGRAERLAGSGLGIEVDEAEIRRLSKRTHQLI